MTWLMKGLLPALFFSLCLTFIHAHEQAVWRSAPWFAPAFELQPSLLYAFQYYSTLKDDHLKDDHSDQRCPSKDHFLDLHNSVTWMQEWQFSFGYSLAQTSRYRFLHGNRFSLEARYLLLDDVIGDPVSLYVGIKGLQNSSQARHDPSILCHGSIGAELEVAVGKEWAAMTDWSRRSWAKLALGAADLGSPWLSALAAGEWKCTPFLLLGACAQWLAGLGKKQISCYNFQGYGSLRHRTVDLCAYLRAELPCQRGALTCSYSCRCYAKNSPNKAQQVMVSYLYPFGL